MSEKYEITATELKEQIDAHDDLCILDVRNPDEFAMGYIPGAKLIPLRELMNRLGELDREAETVVYCRTGIRSARAILMMRQAGFSRLRNLAGGILAWAREVDPTIPRY